MLFGCQRPYDNKDGYKNTTRRLNEASRTQAENAQHQLKQVGRLKESTIVIATTIVGAMIIVVTIIIRIIANHKPVMKTFKAIVVQLICVLP